MHSSLINRQENLLQRSSFQWMDPCFSWGTNGFMKPRKKYMEEDSDFKLRILIANKHVSIEP